MKSLIMSVLFLVSISSFAKAAGVKMYVQNGGQEMSKSFPLTLPEEGPYGDRYATLRIGEISCQLRIINHLTLSVQVGFRDSNYGGTRFFYTTLGKEGIAISGERGGYCRIELIE